MLLNVFNNLFLRGLVLLSKLIFLIIAAKYLAVVEVGAYGFVLAMIMIVAPFCGLNYVSYSKRLLIKAQKEEWPVLLRDHFIFYLATLIVFLPLSLFIFVFDFLQWSYCVWFYLLLAGDLFCEEAYKILVSLERSVPSNCTAVDS